MDVSGSALANLMDAGYLCRHDEDTFFHDLWVRKLMNHYCSERIGDGYES